MKKYIPIISSIVLLTVLSCRQADSIEETPQDHIPQGRNEESRNSKTDTIIMEKDPPVKDGQDWRLYH